MATDKELFGGIRTLCDRMYPGFEIDFKTRNIREKIWGFLVKPFCPDYMTRYTTTFMNKVIFPSEEFMNQPGTWKILAHELVHLVDERLHRVSMPVTYIFPQILAVGALGAIGAFWNLWWLLCLLFLVFGGPWPSLGRQKWEMRGYCMSMAVNFWRYGSIDQGTKDWIVSGPMTGMGYYKMCWSQEKAKKMVEDAADRIADGSVLLEASPNPYLEVYNCLKSLNAVKK
jgi:hypothetical protein